MTRCVYKYPLPAAGPCVVDLPAVAEILSVAFQGRDNGLAPELQLWALVYDDLPLSPRHLFVATTGRAIPLGHMKLIGRAETAGGAYVVHVFEVVG